MLELSRFLSFLNQLKVYHWQTFSYAEHKAFGKAYEDLDELFDQFIEVYYGKYGKNEASTDYYAVAESYVGGPDLSGNAGKPKKNIGNKKRELLAYLRKDLLTETDTDLLNIVDEIEASINRLQYLLDLS